MQRELGVLSKIDARELWPHEAQDFTPWLRKNISLLGKALGMDLDLAQAEVPVGPFAADIVARDVSGNRGVVIENQLAPTDHSHLGQLLTYGAGTRAKVFVWISPEFRDEHRAALDWLNEHSDQDSLFFGVEIELLRIDDSRPAPSFKLVSAPNEWSKHSTGPRPPSERAEAYYQFFTKLLNVFKDRFPGETNVSRAGTSNWLSLSAGRSGFGTAWVFTIEKKFRIELYIDTGDSQLNGFYFEQLYAHREVIEEAIGHQLVWEPLEAAQACRVSLYYDRSPLVVTDGDAVLQPLIEWAAEAMKRFRTGFRPYLQALRTPETTDEREAIGLSSA